MLAEIHIMWTKLSFSNFITNESQPELCIQHELDMVEECFKEVDIREKVKHQTKIT